MMSDVIQYDQVYIHAHVLKKTTYLLHVLNKETGFVIV